MEIKFIHIVFLFVGWFKIDLIVWKLKAIDMIVENKERLK